MPAKASWERKPKARRRRTPPAAKGSGPAARTQRPARTPARRSSAPPAGRRTDRKASLRSWFRLVVDLHYEDIFQQGEVHGRLYGCFGRNVARLKTFHLAEVHSRRKHAASHAI